MNFYMLSLVILLLSMAAQQTFSAEKAGQARLFFGSTQVKPNNLNTELTAQGIKNVDLNNHAGLEITFPVVERLNVGLRYTKRLISQDDELPATDFLAEVTQDVAALVARFTF